MPNGKLQFKALQFKAKIEGKEAGVVAAIPPWMCRRCLGRVRASPSAGQSMASPFVRR
jgi:hypothetical protein